MSLRWVRRAVAGAAVLSALAAPAVVGAQSAPASTFEPIGYGEGPRLPMPRGAQGPRYRGGAIPPGAHLEQQHPTGVLLAGGATLLFAYATSVVLWNVNVHSNCASDRGDFCSNSPWLAVPVVGPWMALGAATNSAEMNVALIADGVLQAAGVAFGLVGVSRGYPVVVFDRGAEPGGGERARRGGMRLALVPGAGTTGLGLSLAGAF